MAATVIISAILVLVAAKIAAGLIKEHKQGKNGCGFSCGGCAMRDVCHSDKK